LTPYGGVVAWKSNPLRKLLPLAVVLSGSAALAACTPAGAARSAPSQQPHQASAAPPASGQAGGGQAGGGPDTGGGRVVVVRVDRPGTAPLPAPAALRPFHGTRVFAREGVWRPAGRLVAGRPAVYQTLLVPPGGTKRAGIAWLDTALLSARLYSGSLSPGGGSWKYTAPVTPAAARSLVAAFNGGFKMADADGGYYSEGRMVRPLVRGAASLVIYADGAVTVGAWGSDVSMTPSVTAVRQNLVPLVVNGRPTARAVSPDWRAWGRTCPCGKGQRGTDRQWRSGLGVTADGALVYVAGAQLTPAEVADLLVRAGVVRGMELDINPTWPVFASFRPAAQGGLAAPTNAVRLLDTNRGPSAFFSPAYARDFITMSLPAGLGAPLRKI
jgi:hypothetical protein